MQKGPKPAELTLSEEEQSRLQELVRRHGTPQQLAKRGRMVLGAAEGKRNAEMARELKVSVDTVRSWRGRWISLQDIPLSELSVSERLTDAPRPGKPSQISAEQRLAYLYFHCGLCPREIVRFCPQEFGDIHEIHRLRRSIMKRLLRNAEKLRWRLG